MKKNIFSKYSFAWITAILFLGSVAGHWTFAWKSYEQEQIEHHQPVEIKGYLYEVSRDTLENWQSEFLQLLWQVIGLSFLYYIGSSQSKEGDDRKEEKIDLIIKMLDPEDGSKAIQKLDHKYPKK